MYMKYNTNLYNLHEIICAPNETSWFSLYEYDFITHFFHSKISDFQ